MAVTYAKLLSYFLTAWNFLKTDSKIHPQTFYFIRRRWNRNGRVPPSVLTEHPAASSTEQSRDGE